MQFQHFSFLRMDRKYDFALGSCLAKETGKMDIIPLILLISCIKLPRTGTPQNSTTPNPHKVHISIMVTAYELKSFVADSCV